MLLSEQENGQSADENIVELQEEQTEAGEMCQFSYIKSVTPMVRGHKLTPFIV